MFSDRLIAPPLLVVALAIAGAISAPVKFAYKSALAGAILIFVLMAYFGSRVAALDNIEPGRFEAPFYFYAVPFAAMAIRRLWIRFGRLQLHRAARILLLTIAALFVLGTMRLVNLDLRFHGSIAATLPPRAAELDDWVAKSDPNARLIVEAGWSITDNQLKLPYFGADLGALWAATSGHQLIGASPSEGFTKFSFTTFDQDHAFGRPVQSWNPAELRKQLDIYNVGAAILWSDAAKQLFDSMPDAHVAAHVATNDGQFALYTIAGTRSFIAQGSAKAVRARPDCIQVTGAASGRMVLKYHYFRTLRVSPPIPIGPAATGNDDPIPFIELRNTASQDLKIYNGGFLGMDGPSCN
jgi:hypothetical protein